jgi:hypothetical protein
MALPDISSLIRSRRALIAVAIGIPLIGAAIAVPAFMGSEPEPVAKPQAATASAVPVQADQVDEAEAEEAEDNTLRPHAGGDLDVSVALRFQRYPAGSAIRAEVSLLNVSLDPVFLPAPSEPQPTLTVLVLDAEGQTVRRVVEETPDATPRRMRRLDSGETTTFRIDVITLDEEALPPGTYQLEASYESAKGWSRTGLPIWTAPQGERTLNP